MCAAQRASLCITRGNTTELVVILRRVPYVGFGTTPRIFLLSSLAVSLMTLSGRCGAGAGTPLLRGWGWVLCFAPRSRSWRRLLPEAPLGGALEASLFSSNSRTALTSALAELWATELLGILVVEYRQNCSVNIVLSKRKPNFVPDRALCRGCSRTRRNACSSTAPLECAPKPRHVGACAWASCPWSRFPRV